MPLSLPDLQAHPAYYIGPSLVGTLVQALEMGFLLNQFFTFWSRSDRGYFVIRFIVIFVTLVAAYVARSHPSNLLTFTWALGYKHRWRPTTFGEHMSLTSEIG